MDLSSIPGATNSPLLTPAVFGDNVQQLLDAGVLNLKPTGIITVNSIDDTVNSSPSVTTLRDAINKANADNGEDLIVFDRSLFSTSQTISLKLGELDITHDLDIVAPRDALTGGDLVTVSGNNTSRVFEISSGATVTLSGLIVESGSVTDNVGGGIKNSGTLTLDSSLIRNNSVKASTATSRYDGGGIFNSGNLTVNNSTVRNNSAFSNVKPDPRSPILVEVGIGGGIRSTGGTLTVDNSTITNNLAGLFGGGIYTDGTVSVSNSTISSNSAGLINSLSFGGGIYGSTVTVENSTISGNSARGDGGGISGGTVTVENSTISGNSAFFGGTLDNLNGSGGGISGSTVTVENSTISGNSARGDGGGIYNGYTGTVTVENSTISGNSARGDGGGIYNGYTGTLTLLFSTVTQNIAANGGGIYQNDVPPFSTPTRGSFNVRNTIIAANHNTDGGVNPDLSGTFTSLGYNIVGTSTGSTGFGVTGDIVGTADSPIDPRLAPLDFNGGPTQTIALLPDSPAIGAADPIVLDTDPTTDQRGLPRRATDGSADIGAFQFS